MRKIARPWLAARLAPLLALVLTSGGPPAIAAPCTFHDAAPAIARWFGAWELASREILRLPEAPAPNFVFFDSTCVFTTSAVTARGGATGGGPPFRAAPLPWRTVAHGDTIMLPRGEEVPVGLMSFADSDKATGPYFVMALPSYWNRAGHRDPNDFTGVFLHEFTHTRQLAGVAGVIGPIDSTWQGERELDDDCVQHAFGADSVYVAAWRAERDLLYAAARAGTADEARARAAEALALMRARHARYFTGDRAVYATLDDVFLSLEGAAQWTAMAWLARPDGGGLDKEAAIAKMLGRRRWWSQDEGLALFLAVDRLLPEWPSLVFAVPSAGATALLARAVGEDVSE